ncbi:hypothetical protein ACL07V_11970 [Streptomyces sp. MB22_4]|uniref:hypothetical protein n=1 Tax=unclassified Streptomyces TaxID=2593676 RepID=UPI002552AD4B|nr:hypothetical protein [Streptomyces hygroscopicus]
MPDMSASVSLAATDLVSLADLDQNKVTPGVLGFIVFAVMAVAVWGLMKSMNKHMRKVDFKEPGASGGPAEDSGKAETVGGGTSAKG